MFSDHRDVLHHSVHWLYCLCCTIYLTIELSCHSVERPSIELLQCHPVMSVLTAVLFWLQCYFLARCTLCKLLLVFGFRFQRELWIMSSNCMTDPSITSGDPLWTHLNKNHVPSISRECYFVEVFTRLLVGCCATLCNITVLFDHCL